MKSETLLRAILPDVLIDNFDVVNFEKTDVRFDIWFDEKKVQMYEDKQPLGLITRMAAKVVAFTMLQYFNLLNHKPIGQVKYAMF